jgi:antitoxin PrlF
MSESTITVKGQTTVPQPIREFLNAQAGTKLQWHLMPDGTITVRVKTKSIADLAGMLKTQKRKKVLVSDMNAWS